MILAPRFDSYSSLKRFVWNEYVPLESEITPRSLGFAEGTHWAKRNLPRFYRALRFVSQHASKGARLLDIGSYPGSFPRLLKKACADDLAIVASGFSLDATFAAAMHADGIAFVSTNLDPDVLSPVPAPTALPLDSQSIDIVTCMEVVEHLYSLKTLMSECHRVLKPGGVLYLVTNNVLDRVGLLRVFEERDTNLDQRLALTSILSDHTDRWRGHVRFFSAKQLATVGTVSGFELVSAGGFEVYEDPGVFVMPNSWLSGARRLLRGDGGRPPIRLSVTLRSIRRLGFASLGSDFDSHVEVMLKRI